MASYRNVLRDGLAAVGIAAKDKAGALEAAAGLLAAGAGLDKGRLLVAVAAREKLSSTGIGEGVAIPHALMEGVEATTMAVARLAEPVDFDAEDGGPVDLVFMIAGPRSDTGGHLKLLSKLARTLHDPEFRKAAREAPDGPALARLIYDRD